MFGVVSLTMGNSGLPFLDGLAGDAQQTGKPLLAQTGLLSQLIEPLLKSHGKDLLFASARGHTGAGPCPFRREKDSKKGPAAQPKVGYNLTTSGCKERKNAHLAGKSAGFKKHPKGAEGGLSLDA
jgi:hypothetical protein